PAGQWQYITVYFDGGGSIDEIAFACGSPPEFFPPFIIPLGAPDSEKGAPKSRMSEIASKFNATPVAPGAALWFSSAMKVRGVGEKPVTVRVVDAAID